MRDIYTVKIPVGRAFCAFLLLFPAFALLLLFPAEVDADGGAPNLAYVAGTSQGVSVIDIAQQKVTDTIAVGGDPHTIFLSLDGRLLYVTQPTLGQVTVIATKTKQVICSASVPGRPTVLTLDPGTNVLYVAGNEASSVTALNPTTCAVLRTLKVSSAVYGLAVAIVGAGIAGGGGNQLWVADANGLTVFDTMGKQLRNIPIAGGPQYLTIPIGPTAYVTTRQGDVEAVDLNSYHVLPPLLTGGTFGPMDYNGITGEVYVPDEQHKLIDVLAPVNGETTTLPREPNRVIRLDGAPQSVAITSDGQFGFVAFADGSVVMLDIPGRQMVKMFSVGGMPHFIITGLYPSLISLTPQQSFVLRNLGNIVEFTAAGGLILFTVLLIVSQRRRQSKLKG